jgi:hypothetical protein
VVTYVLEQADTAAVTLAVVAIALAVIDPSHAIVALVVLSLHIVKN